MRAALHALTRHCGSSDYNQDMQAPQDISEGETEADRRSSNPAEHIAWVAEALASMPADIAISMSTTQRIGPAALSTIRGLLPALAARYDLHVRLENDNGSVTVWFDRRRS